MDVISHTEKDIEKVKKKKHKKVSDDVKVETVKEKRRKKESDVEENEESTVKKFKVSLKMQSSLVDKPILSNSEKKGPKIIIAKSKKEKEETENKPAKKLNKRRRKKIQQGLPVEDTIHETKGQAKALQYLKTWNEDKDNWKFEKCRQIWLLHNAYEKTKVSDVLFPVLLSYMESIKGGMRNLALDIANKKLAMEEKVENEENEEENKAVKQVKEKQIVTEAEKERAKQVIEMLS